MGGGVNILVVDDEQIVLDSLRRVLSSLGSDAWDISYASSGEQALELLDASRFDLLITDIRMPGMDGADLLASVAERWPRIARFALSADTNRDNSIRAAAAAHQFLGKPCAPNVLIAAITQIERLGEGAEVAAIRTVVSSVRRLPTVPALFATLRTALNNERGDVRVVADLVRQDPSLSAKVLQLVNSSFFFRGSTISHVQAAISRLGVSLLSRLVLVDGLMSNALTVDRAYEREVQRFFSASLVAEAAVSAPHRDDAALAVLLCPIGRAVLIAADPSAFSRATKLVDDDKLALVDAEREVFGTTHAAVGSYLISLWGLPRPVGDAVGLQHQPTTFRVGDQIHAATLLANRDVRGLEAGPIALGITEEWDRNRARLEMDNR